MPAPLSSHLRRHPLRFAAVALAALILALAVGLAAVLAAVDAGGFDRLVADAASKRLKRPVAFASLSSHLLSARPTATVTGLRIGNPAWAGPGDLFAASRLVVELDWSDILIGRVRPTSIVVEAPRANLIRLGPGKANWSDDEGDGSDGAASLSTMRALRITDGRFTLDDRVSGLKLAGVVSHHDALVASATGTLLGDGVALRFAGARLNARDARAPYPFTAKIQDGAATIDAKGTMTRPLSLKGFDLRVASQGPNLAVMKYLIDVGLPNSRPYRLTGRLVREDRTTRATEMQATIGQSDFSGSIVSDGSKARRRISIDLTSDTLHGTDVAAFLAHIPPHAQTRSVPGKAGGNDDGKLLSSKPLNLVRFRKRDYDLKIEARRFVVGGIGTGRLSAKGAMDRGVFTLKPFALVFPNGRADGTLRIDVTPPNPAVGLDLSARGPLTTLLPSLAGDLNSDARIAVHLAGAGPSWRAIGLAARGTASLSLKGGELEKSKAKVLSGAVLTGALTSLVAKNARTDLRCATADMEVGGGRMRGRRVLMVTGAGVAMGVGQIDLASETIDMTVYGRPTGLKLFTADKPVAVRGPMLSPKVDILPKGAPGAPAPEVPKAATRLCG